MRTRPLLLLLILSFFSATTLAGQTSDTVTLAVDDQGTVSANDTLRLTPDTETAIVACPSTLDCLNATARVTNADASLHAELDSVVVSVHEAGGIRAHTITVALSPALFGLDGERRLTIQGLLATAPNLAGGNPRLVSIAVTVQQTVAETVMAQRPLRELLLSSQCRNQLAQTANALRGNFYARDTAQFVVDPLGNVAGRPAENIDEDDVVLVTVVGATELMNKIRVARVSAFRTPNVFNILGVDSQIPVEQLLQRQAAAVPCGRIVRPVQDFAPGRGEVELTVPAVLRAPAEGEAATDLSLGTFDFGVNRLYSGALSLGAVWSSLGDAQFGLVYDGQDSVITQTRDSPAPEATEPDGGRFFWGLFYHPFIPKRDVAKETTRLTAAFGVGLNNVSQNFLIGASLDAASSIYLILGAHFGLVTALDERSGLKLGDPFEGTSDQIPTVDKWSVGFFVGGTLDVRAAVALIKAAFGGAT